MIFYEMKREQIMTKNRHINQQKKKSDFRYFANVCKC